MTKVYYDINCLVDSNIRTFPISKHRSKRIHKKLCKRFNGEFKKEPGMYKLYDKIICHPSLREEIEKVVEVQKYEYDTRCTGSFTFIA